MKDLNYQRKKAYWEGDENQKYLMDNGIETIVRYGGKTYLRYDYKENDLSQWSYTAIWDTTEEKWI